MTCWCLFTDGVSDARSPDDARLGEDRVLDTIRAHRDASPSEILERVIEVLDAHTRRSAAPRRPDARSSPFVAAVTRPPRGGRVATRPSADQEESRSAFSQRSPNSPAHRRRSRADRRGDGDRGRSGAGKPERAAGARCRSSRVGGIRSRARRAAPRAIRDHAIASASSRRTFSPSISPRPPAARFVSSATCRTTSRRRSFFTRSSARVRSERLPGAARGRGSHRGGPGVAGVRRAVGERAGCCHSEAALSRRARIVSTAAQGGQRGDPHRTACRSGRDRRTKSPRFVGSFSTRSGCVESRCAASCARSGSCQLKMRSSSRRLGDRAECSP